MSDRIHPQCVSRLRLVISIGLVSCLMVACTSVKFEGTGNRLDVLPMDVFGQGGAVNQGTVVWGGRILEVSNLQTGTELLILALPLNGGNVPRIEQASVGRFVARKGGYLEPMDFAPGRYVSLAGVLTGTTSEWQYEGVAVDLPMVEVRQIHLWPADPSSWHRRMNIGLSISVHN